MNTAAGQRKRLGDPLHPGIGKMQEIISASHQICEDLSWKEAICSGTGPKNIAQGAGLRIHSTSGPGIIGLAMTSPTVELARNRKFS